MIVSLNVRSIKNMNKNDSCIVNCIRNYYIDNILIFKFGHKYHLTIKDNELCWVSNGNDISYVFYHEPVWFYIYDSIEDDYERFNTNHIDQKIEHRSEYVGNHFCTDIELRKYKIERLKNGY